MSYVKIYRYFILVLGFLLLSACFEKSTESNNKDSSVNSALVEWSSEFNLHFSYPYPGQVEVPANAPIVIRFSEELSEISNDEIENIISLTNIENSERKLIEAKVLDDHRGLIITPLGGLSNATKYHLDLSKITSSTGKLLSSVNSNRFEFTTAGLHSTQKDRIGSGPFVLLSASPMDQFGALGNVPLVDVSTFRFSFSYPLDPKTIKYGDNVRIEARENKVGWKLVAPVRVINQGRYLSLDPIDSLKPNLEYRIVFAGLGSQYGELLKETEIDGLYFKDTNPKEHTVAKLGNQSESDGDVALLTEKQKNSIVIDTHVIGKENVAVLSGDLPVDIGFIPNLVDRGQPVAPLTVPAGTTLSAGELPVRVVGAIPAGIETGNITMTLLSDANGYLFPNPFSTASSAPKIAVLTMDAAMTAVGDVANGALSQSLLNVVVVGTAIVEKGILKLDAVGFVQPEVLGFEKGKGLFSLHGETYPDLRNVKVPPMDASLPSLQTITHDRDHWGSIRPGDPVIVNFTKPISPESINEPGAVTLWKDGENLTALGKAPMRMDGASLVIEGTEVTHNSSYKLELNNELIKDLQGNPLDKFYSLDILPSRMVLPENSYSNLRSPMVTNMYPGMTCALTDQNVSESLNVSQWTNGRCVGGRADDLLYVVPNIAPAERIRVVFSREIDPLTVNEKTFFVESRLKSGGEWKSVSGTIKKWPERLEFYPNRPWVPEYVYRQTLKSNGDVSTSRANCGEDAICSKDGAPLRTQLIAPNRGSMGDHRGGGADITNYFVVNDVERIYASLRLLPTVDVNANLLLDGEAQQGVSSGEKDGGAEEKAKWVDNELIVPTNHLQLELSGMKGVLTAANVGCNIGVDCPENRFAYVAQGGLNAVVTDFDPDVIVERRLVDGDLATHEDTKGAVLGFIPPTVLTTTGAYLEATALNLIKIGLDTGPLVLRTQQVVDGRLGDINGYITDTKDGPWFSANADFILDAPYLRAAVGPIVVSHDLHSKLIDHVKLEGPLRFAKDGRLDLKLQNPEPIVIEANISLLGINLATVALTVPPLGAKINFVFLPIKEF